MKKILFTLVLSCVLLTSFAQKSPQIIFLSGGEIKGERQVYQTLDKGSEEIKRGRNLFGSGWAAQSANLYMMAQRYLMHAHQRTEVLPLFVILDKSADYSYGKGVSYSDGKNIIDLPEAWYIKIHPQVFANDRGALDAPQLIFSEAAGCIVANLMLGEQRIDSYKFSNKTPYFSVPTDYSTALIHGYGYYWRYLNYLVEPNPITRNAVAENMNVDKKEIARILFGYERDMKHFYRIGLYKFLMPHWAPKVERVKTITFIKNNWAKLPSRPITEISSDKATYYRDAAFLPDPKGVRNYYQLYEVGGVVANFFGILVKSNIGKTPINPEITNIFTGDTSVSAAKPLDPLTLSNIKFLLTFAQMKNLPGVENHSMGGFVNAYTNLFQQDSADIYASWKVISNQDWRQPIASEIWIELKNVRWINDIAFPYNYTSNGYRFNINAADSIDLMQIPGFTPEMALDLIKERDQTGPFTSINQVLSLPFLTQPIKDIIKNGQVNQPVQLVGQQKMITSEASLNAHMSLIFSFVILWIVSSIILVVPFIIGKKAFPLSNIIWHAFNLFLLYIIALATIATGFKPLLISLIALVLISALIFFFNRKEDWAKWVRLISFIIPAAVIVLSAL